MQSSKAQGLFILQSPEYEEHVVATNCDLA